MIQNLRLLGESDCQNSFGGSLAQSVHIEFYDLYLLCSACQKVLSLSELLNCASCIIIKSRYNYN